MNINPNVIKWIRIGIEAAFLLTFLFLCITVGVKNKAIRVLKEQVKTECMMTDSLQARCERYGQMDCISVATTFVINTKNVLSVNTTQANNVSRTYSAYTKREVLAALDSLEQTRNNN